MSHAGMNAAAFIALQNDCWCDPLHEQRDAIHASRSLTESNAENAIPNTR